MAETLDISCPNGCFELTVSGSHAGRDDMEFLKDVAIDKDPGRCPNCGTLIEVPG